MPSVIVLNARKRTRRLPGIRAPKSVEVRRRAMLDALIAPMLEDVATRMFSAEGNESRVMDTVVSIRETQAIWESYFSSIADSFAYQWTTDVDLITKEKIADSVGKALGVDMPMILDSPEVSESIRLSSVEAADLIRTIPKDYIGRVSQAVYQSFRQQPFPEGRTLAQEIQFLSGVTRERARVIARDQTSKMNASLTEIRQTNLGIEEYIWRTAEDRRVVGTPGGKYPEGNSKHGNHYVRNGKIFRWDSPPPDGHPGWPIQCRCVALGIVDRSKLREVTGRDGVTGWRLM